MPSDRQRAKQRQAERRAERLAARRSPRTGESVDPELEREADFEVGAPPEDLGRSDTVTAHPPMPPDTRTGPLDEDEIGSNGGLDAAVDGPHERGRAADQHRRGRLAAFLVAVWAELGRVQWPDRKQLTQLTGVVLFFVIIVGAYLGALDAIFSKVVQAIL